MALDAEARRQIVLSLAVGSFFTALLVGIGLVYGGSSLSPSGGFALIGAIVLFVLVMAAVGVYLDRRG